MEIISVNQSFCDKEDIVSKLRFIEYLESYEPYPQAGGLRCFERIKRTLQGIPSEYHKFALALFSSVIYLPRSWLDESLPYLLEGIAKGLNVTKKEIIDNTMLFDLDWGEGLVYRFIQKNRIRGRLDITRFPRISTIDDLTEKLFWLASSTQKNKGTKEDIKRIFKKRFWLLISEKALSGTSMISEIDKALQLTKLMGSSSTIVIPVTQIITEIAEREITEKMKESENPHRPISAFRLDSAFRVHPDNHNCKLFSSPKTLEGVIKLCDWFATETYFANDPELTETKKLSGDDMRYGFKAGGWTLVTSNCPENSIPLLWYESRDYVGPFLRVRSRIDQARGRSWERIKALRQLRTKLLEKLEGN